jgi:outer membrane protein
MYKQSFVCTLLLGSLLFAGQALAEIKVGYLDVIRVAEESPQFRAASKTLKQEAERRESDLRAQVEKLKKLEEQYKKDAKVLSDAELKRLERDILARQRKLKNQRDEYRDEFSMRQNEERNKLMRQVAEVVRAIGKEERFDLILTDGVAYHSRGVDISDRVLSRLKESAR